MQEAEALKLINLLMSIAVSSGVRSCIGSETHWRISFTSRLHGLQFCVAFCFAIYFLPACYIDIPSSHNEPRQNKGVGLQLKSDVVVHTSEMGLNGCNALEMERSDDCMPLTHCSQSLLRVGILVSYGRRFV